MIKDTKEFWQRLRTGVEVAVAGPSPDKLLGVRDGFLRYFRDGFDRSGRSVSVAVVPQTIEEPPLGLLISDQEVIRLTRQRAIDLESALADNYHFYVASEAGLHSIEVEGKLRYFVRYWTVVRGPVGESWGSSGSIQLPERLVHGLDSEQIPFAVPGTRKRGGMISSLTGQLENRRTAIASSTVHAISSLFYGVIESRARR
jgi:non-canonical (house-cleaning) NTP pyrophosphatase